MFNLTVLKLKFAYTINCGFSIIEYRAKWTQYVGLVDLYSQLSQCGITMNRTDYTGWTVSDTRNSNLHHMCTYGPVRSTGGNWRRGADLSINHPSRGQRPAVDVTIDMDMNIRGRDTASRFYIHFKDAPTVTVVTYAYALTCSMNI